MHLAHISAELCTKSRTKLTIIYTNNGKRHENTLKVEQSAEISEAVINFGVQKRRFRFKLLGYFVQYANPEPSKKYPQPPVCKHQQKIVHVQVHACWLHPKRALKATSTCAMQHLEGSNTLESQCLCFHRMFMIFLMLLIKLISPCN